MRNERDTSPTSSLSIWPRRAALCLAVGVLALPLGAFAVSLPTPQPNSGDPIYASEVWANFETLAAAVTDLEAVAVSDSVPGLFCTTETSPCTSADLVTPAIPTDGELTLRVELFGHDEGESEVSYLQLDGNGGQDALADVIFERSTDGGVWTVVATQRIRNYISGISAGLLSLPCGSFSVLDTPPSGNHEYRVSLTAGGGPARNSEIRHCRLAATTVGRMK